MRLALCLPYSSAVLGGSEIFLRRGEGNARQSVPGVFDIVLFRVGVWSISHRRIFKETEKYNQIFPTEVEITLCTVRLLTRNISGRRIGSLAWGELSSSLDTSVSNDFADINGSTLSHHHKDIYSFSVKSSWGA